MKEYKLKIWETAALCALCVTAVRLRVGAGAAAGYKLVARAVARYRGLG